MILRVEHNGTDGDCYDNAVIESFFATGKKEEAERFPIAALMMRRATPRPCIRFEAQCRSGPPATTSLSIELNSASPQGLLSAAWCWNCLPHDSRVADGGCSCNDPDG